MTCIGCELREDAQQVDVAALIQEQLSWEQNLAAQTVVSTRVACCQACPFRVKHTCTKCGCYYEFRANLAIKTCPVGHW